MLQGRCLHCSEPPPFVSRLFCTDCVPDEIYRLAAKLRTSPSVDQRAAVEEFLSRPVPGKKLRVKASLHLVVRVGAKGTQPAAEYRAHVGVWRADRGQYEDALHRIDRAADTYSETWTKHLTDEVTWHFEGPLSEHRKREPDENHEERPPTSSP